MSSSPRRLGRRHRFALTLPAVLLVSTALTGLNGPAFADDPGSAQDGTSSATQAADPSPAPAGPADETKAPEPKAEAPSPAADAPKSEAPKSESPKSESPSATADASAPAAGDKAAGTSGDKAAAEPVQASPAASTPLAQAIKADASAKAAAADVEVNDKKVVVCKYVSTPGGYSHHVIVPSVNSLKDWTPADGFPNWAFADAQNSVVLRFLNADEKPGQVPDSVCPTLMPRPKATLVDPCGPSNAKWSVPLSEFYTVTTNPDGSVKITANPGYWFAPLSVPPTTVISLGVPTESNVPCTDKTPIAAPEPRLDDPCGPNNATWLPPLATADYTITGPDQQGNYTATVTNPNTVFPNGLGTIVVATKPDPADSGDACTKKVVVCKNVSTPPGFSHHIVIVSVNATDYNGTFPTDFDDAHGSIVVGWADKGDNPADYSDLLKLCPQQIAVPTVPQVDPCNPAGVTSNIAFGPLPASDGTWTAQTSQDGKTITFTATGNNAFGLVENEEGDLVYQKTAQVHLGTDSGVACIVPPTLSAEDPCGPNNASWKLPTATDKFTVELKDGVIVLTATGTNRFEGDKTTYTYPDTKPVDSNVACTVSPTRAVVCATPVAPSASAVPGTINIVNIADLIAKGFKGTYPFVYVDGGITYEVVRSAGDTEVASTVTGISCGVDAAVEDKGGKKDDGDIESAQSGLPNTGGPAGWLLPFGVGLVLAGAGLIATRRKQIV